MRDPNPPVPLRFDLSALVRRSVANLYSHLVTRPTGQALRIGIESQILELGALCVSVLDFSQVVILDYSCADETVAKLLQRYERPDRPADAYFVARGVADRHREAIEEVLVRHRLALAAEVDGTGPALLGAASPEERAAWHALEDLVRADARQVGARIGTGEEQAGEVLAALARRRVILDGPRTGSYAALSALVR